MPSVRSYPSFTGICGVMSLSRSQASSFTIPSALSAAKSSQLKAEGRFGSIDHRPGCRNLVMGTRWRRLDIDDDYVLDIDHVVEPIAKLDTLLRFRSPGRAWIAW